MSTQILAICGVSLLGVLCDLIMPDGSTKKYVRTVTGIVVTLVVVRCVFGLLGEVNQTSVELLERVQTDYIEVQNERIKEKNLQYVVDRLGLTEKTTFAVDGETVTFNLDENISADKQKALKQAVHAIYGDKFTVEFTKSPSFVPSSYIYKRVGRQTDKRLNLKKYTENTHEQTERIVEQTESRQKHFACCRLSVGGGDDRCIGNRQLRQKSTTNPRKSIIYR